jgi:thiol:disulfide interchange protein DsbD
LDVLNGRPPPDRTSYVLVEGDRAWEFNDVPVRIASKMSDGSLPVPMSLGLVLGSAFVGGLLLNFMPCVFPVLVIKLLGFVRAERTRAEQWCAGLWYTGGVLTTFLALGAVLLALRSAGAALGWGFQLQSPVIVLLLVVMFWVMGLNLLGVFEFGLGLMRFAGRQGGQSGGPSAFATGALAVFVAAPCTGPFMGSALGAAALLPAHEAMAIFLGLGVGFAAPLLVFAGSPAVAAYIPQAGSWMETLKHGCAFPLFATVVWLLWILGLQTGIAGWLSAAMLLLAVSFSLWLGRFTSRVIRSLAWLLAGVMLLYSSVQVGSMSAATPTPASSAWIAYDSTVLAATQAQGQAVFVDFTAAWCITCQINKKAVLETSSVSALFRTHNVLLMRGDWTSQDPTITEALVAFGRNSVPLYVFYAADGSAPRVLPQILTLSTIETLFNP